MRKEDILNNLSNNQCVTLI